MAARLTTYRQKRNFAQTPEPSGGSAAGPSGSRRFVVQHHLARRDHFDFRLEIGGVLASWAVTRGPSAKPGTRRLAVRTEDHPLEYATFEGVIPPKSYGAGPVMIWDEGTFESETGDVAKALADGHIKVTLAGSRMHGRWALVRMNTSEARENWLLIKDRDGFAETDDGLAARFTTSVVSGRSFDEIIAGEPSRAHRAGTGAAFYVPDFVPPMLASLSTSVPVGPDWRYEMKYDGYRLQVAIAKGAVKIRTRKGLDWTSKFPAIAAAAAKIDVQDCVLDGEAVILNDRGISDFPALVRALESAPRRIIFVAFDILRLNGKSLLQQPWTARRKQLDAVLAPHTGPTAVIRLAHSDAGDGKKLLGVIAAAGGEGIIAKRRESHYVSDRSKSWLKIKALERDDAVIVGYQPSDRGRSFASLLLAMPQGKRLRYVGRVGTGFDDRTLADLSRRFAPLQRPSAPEAVYDLDPTLKGIKWLQPDLIASVRYAGWTGDKRLRAAAYLGLREDLGETAAPAQTTSATGRTSGARRPGRITGEPAMAHSSVQITHPERVMYPGTGFTKGDMAAYYRAIAHRMLPHVTGRPVSLVRAPDGVTGELFFQRHPMPAMTAGVERFSDPQKTAKQPYMILDGVDGLQTAVQFGAVEIHGWGARQPKMDRPDRLIFDFDPDEGVTFEGVKKAAIMLRDVLGAAGLTSFPLISGGKGIHVVVPLGQTQEWEIVEGFASGMARKIAALDPANFVATMSKSRRKGRIFIDWLRNKRSATAILPYSLRARAANSVAVPVTWPALKTVERADVMTPSLVLASAHAADPWDGFFKLKQKIPAAALKMVSG